MNTDKCKELLQGKKFDELLDLLEDELKELYKEMLSYADTKFEDGWGLKRLGVEVSDLYPSYFNSVIMCENALYSGEYNYGESIDMILDSYYNISKNYKGRLRK